MENWIQYLIYIHAFIGGVGLASGSMSMVFKKGGNVHKKAGNVFVFSMVISAVLSLIISTLPNHKSTFLFLIGVFTIYLTLTGYRALRFNRGLPTPFDKILSWLMIFGALYLIFTATYPLITLGRVLIVPMVFGWIGFSLALRDLNWYKNPDKLRKSRMQLHISKIVGAYIAATTAFFVTNQIVPGVFAWLTPTILGTAYIIYWSRKFS